MAGKLARRAGVGGGESVWNVISRRRAQSHIVANPAPVSSACGAIACFLPVESPEIAAIRLAALEITQASPMCLKRRADRPHSTDAAPDFAHRPGAAPVLRQPLE
jgi:hypothetical protein